MIRMPLGSDYGGVISDKYNSFDDDKFTEMQKRARECYESYLRPDSFFKFIFSANYLERTKNL